MRLAILALSIPVLHAASVIPEGSHVLLRLVNSVSTRTAREGDRVYMKTATPIVVNGEFVVPVDSYVQGVVAHARRSGRVTGRAELSIRIENLTLPSGQSIQLSRGSVPSIPRAPIRKSRPKKAPSSRAPAKASMPSMSPS